MNMKKANKIEEQGIFDIKITERELDIFIEAFRDILNDLVVHVNECKEGALYISRLLDRLILIYMRITSKRA